MSYHGLKVYYKSKLLLSTKNIGKENIIEQAILTDQVVNEDIYHDEYTEGFTKHASVLTFVWTVLNFTGFVFARYKRHYESWMFYHQLCNGTAALMSLLSGFMAIRLSKTNTNTYNLNYIYIIIVSGLNQAEPVGNIKYHHLLGITIMVLSFLEILGGISIYYLGANETFIWINSKLKVRTIHRVINNSL